MFALICLLALTSLAWIGPAQSRVEPTRTAKAHVVIHYAGITKVPVMAKTPEPFYYLNTGTPLPPDWVNNAQQTDSIIIGAVILVLVVLIGTLASVRARK